MVDSAHPQLMEALDRQIYSGENTIGDETKVQQCITETINGGGSDEDILKNICNFYKGLV